MFDWGDFICSGVRISESEIMTAEHCIRDTGRLSLAIEGVGLKHGNVQGYDRDRDIALVTFDASPTGEIAPIDPSPVTQDIDGQYRLRWGLGYEIAVIGFVERVSETTPLITFGRIGVIWNILPGEYAMGQMDAEGTGGMSGGGVFNKWGDLIGFLQAGEELFGGNTRFLLVSEIGEVLEDLRRGVKQ